MAKRPSRSDGRPQRVNLDVEMEDLVAPDRSPVTTVDGAEVISDIEHDTFQDQWCMPQLGAAVPVINEASMRFAKTASDIGRRLAGFVEEAVARDLRPQSSTGDLHESISIPDIHSNEPLQVAIPDMGSTATPGDNTTAVSTFSVERATSLISQTSTAVVGLGQSFLSFPPALWQGEPMGQFTWIIGDDGPAVPVEISWCPGNVLIANKTWGNMELARRYIFELMGFGFAWRLAVSFLRFVLNRLERTRARWKRVVARVQTTLRGSGDDIGWLQKTPGLPPVEDGTERFVQHLERTMSGMHVLPDNVVYLLVPGLFSNHGPLYFVDTKKYFSKMGLSCYIAKIHSEAAVETNALQLKDYIEELFWGTGKRVVLLGHSKGGVDAAAALSMYWDELRDKVLGLVAVQSPYGGSPIASDILREGQIADIETRRIMEMLICKIIKGDMRALEDLTYQRRREFLSRYPVAPEFPMISFHTEASKAPGVLSIMSQIAHAELPWLPGPSNAQVSDEVAATKTLPVVIPLAAAMAVCALHLELRYGEKSDGLVARKDAEIPGSVVVKPDRKLDHAWMVYSPAKKDEKEADSAQMCEALLSLLMEVREERLDRALRTVLAS